MPPLNRILRGAAVPAFLPDAAEGAGFSRLASSSGRHVLNRGSRHGAFVLTAHESLASLNP
jgi:hypothetical protein